MTAALRTVFAGHGGKEGGGEEKLIRDWGAGRAGLPYRVPGDWQKRQLGSLKLMG